MINVNQITSTLAKLPDPALQKYAAMHKDDPYIMALAVAESNRRKQMRGAAQAPQGEMPKVVDEELAGMASQTLPEDQGIARLPAGNMNFADGGIVAFAGGAKVEADSKAKLFEAALNAEGVRDPRERAFLTALFAQESDSGRDTRTSNRGARGPMQILPKTFKGVADKGMDIDNPTDNMRAGIRYGREGYRAAGGNPVLGGAYYYGGPYGLEKARRGIAVADSQNPDYPTTLTYGQKIAKRMTELLPISAANAEPMPPAVAPAASNVYPDESRRGRMASAPAASNVYPDESRRGRMASAPAAGRPTLTREQMLAQIPGQDGRPVPVNVGYAEPDITLLQRVTAPGAVARTLGQNLLAIPGSAVLSGLSQLRSGPGMSQEEAYRALAHTPSNPAAQQQLETIGRVVEDLKLPPYIPSLTPVRGPRPPAAQAAQDVAKAKAPRLPPPAPPTPAAGKVAAPRLPPPAPSSRVAGASPESEGVLRIHPDRAAALEQRRLATLAEDMRNAREEAAGLAELDKARMLGLADDQAAAARAAQYMNERNANIANVRAINEALPGQTGRLGLAGAIGEAATAGAAAPPAAVSAPKVPGPGESGWGADLGKEPVPDKLDKLDKQEIIDAAKETGAKPPKGEKWTGEDWLALGLNLMATKSPRFLQSVGDAGLATLKSRQERLKTEREQENEAIANAYRQAGTKKLTAETAELTSPTARTNLALKAADTMFDNWVARIKTNLAEGTEISQADADAQYQTFLKRAFAAYKIPVPAEFSTATTGVGNFKVLGSRPAP